MHALHTTITLLSIYSITNIERVYFHAKDKRWHNAVGGLIQILAWLDH
jgi:hypothetical protein